ncbi:hypothetical protein [Bradyrhizobium japonicum]|uniref:hypothetical protein n=1 Tax=Bradyrhizobium japonicum TaxID=375 RepID=UPI001CB6B9CD|nr:hypothetical protein [Bradyrhizobium japonicum]
MRSANFCQLRSLDFERRQLRPVLIEPAQGDSPYRTGTGNAANTKSPGEPGLLHFTSSLSRCDSRCYCNPVGLVVLPIGVIVPPAPLFVKRLFECELTVPDTPVLLNERSLLDRLTDPPTCLMPIVLKEIVVASNVNAAARDGNAGNRVA